MILTIELDQEEDGPWIAEVVDIPGALAYGITPEQATAKAKAIASRVLADQLEHGEATGVEAAWADEIARRLQDLDSGKAKTIPWSQARRMILPR